jgi:hypothetical protein
MVFIISTGCGVYSFSPSSKPPFESINVPQFENNTIEYQLSDRLTDAVIDGFIRENLVKVQEASQAEAILYGTVANYRRDPYTYDQEDIVTEYAVKVTVRVKVTRANSEDVVWEDDFYAQGIYNANEESEEDGQNRAISLITSDIMDRTTKSW